jgi:hypothetical protein
MTQVQKISEAVSLAEARTTLVSDCATALGLALSKTVSIQMHQDTLAAYQPPGSPATDRSLWGCYVTVEGVGHSVAFVSDLRVLAVELGVTVPAVAEDV